MKEYNKLVRDNIPNIINSNGDCCDYEFLSSEKYQEMLDKKLLEEINEYLESKEIEELADIEEIIRAILINRNVSLEEFEGLLQEKHNKRGGYEKRILLKRTYSSKDIK